MRTAIAAAESLFPVSLDFRIASLWISILQYQWYTSLTLFDVCHATGCSIRLSPNTLVTKMASLLFTERFSQKVKRPPATGKPDTNLNKKRIGLPLPTPNQTEKVSSPGCTSHTEHTIFEAVDPLGRHHSRIIRREREPLLRLGAPEPLGRQQAAHCDTAGETWRNEPPRCASNFFLPQRSGT